MRPTIFGLEKEYGLYPDFFLFGAFGRTLLFNCASRYIQRLKGQSLSHDFWLTNAARLYMDSGDHVEYSSPECVISRHVLVWQKAGDEILMDMIDGANDLLWQMLSANDAKQLLDEQTYYKLKHYIAERHLEPASEIIRLYRNSIDIRERNTYGEHENHLVRRECVNSMGALYNFRGILLAHLISRIIWQGSGIVYWDSDHWEYRLSQREFCTGSLVLSATTGHLKPLINERDEPHACPEKWYRLHIVGGDANMAEIPSRLKFGTTALVIQMIEDGYFRGKNFDFDYRADDMRIAYRAFSRDMTLRKAYKFPDGNYSALDLQWMLLERAEEYVNKGGAERTPDIQWTLEWWRKILDLVSADNPHEKLARYTDVSAKLFLILRDMEKYGYSWRSNPDHSIEIIKKDGSRQSMTVAARLWFWELEYHRLSRTRGIFQKLSMERVVSPDEIAFAKENPPYGTRAETRRKYCDYLSESGGSVDVVNWDLVKGQDNRGNVIEFLLSDPFAKFENPEVF